MFIVVVVEFTHSFEKGFAKTDIVKLNRSPKQVTLEMCGEPFVVDQLLCPAVESVDTSRTCLRRTISYELHVRH